MEKVATLLRNKNVEFFIQMHTEKTSKAAARKASITPQHGRKLIRVWVKAGWIEKKPTLHGQKYFFTKKGDHIRETLAKVVTDVNKW